MFIKKIYIKNFKILEHLELDLHPKINFFSGNNGYGKTTLLESIYTLLTSYSFFKNKDKDLIKNNHNFYELGAYILKQDLNHKLFLHYSHEKKKKKYSLDQKKVLQHKVLLEKFPVVYFTPFDIQNIIGEPQNRRSFFNRMISYLSPNYYQLLKEYNKILKEKNYMLKTREYSMLEIWNERLIDLNFKIVQKRLEYIEKYKLIHTQKKFPRPEFLTPVTWKYKGPSTLEKITEIANSMLPDEKKRNISLWGVHRDDILIIDDSCNQQIKNLFSLGQIKWASFYLKILEISLMNQELMTPPPFLIDDIFSELDNNNQALIFDLLEKLPNQLFLTSTHQPIKKSHIKDYILYHFQDFGSLKKIKKN